MELTRPKIKKLIIFQEPVLRAQKDSAIVKSHKSEVSSETS